MELNSHNYEIDGQVIHAVELGRPDRQVALMIHGWSSSWYAMSPLLTTMSHRFRSIAIDLPGYGQSPRLSEKTTIPAYVDLLAKFIEEVSSGPVVLVGHSMGGMISATLALHYPLLVDRIVMLNPTLSGKLSNGINMFISPITMMERFGLGGLIVSSFENTFMGLTDRLMRPVSFAERTGITAVDYKRLRADARRPGQGRVRAECYFAMRDNNLSGRLGNIEAPSLVIWGAEDNTVPLRDAGIVADEWPAADLRILPKAGHWPQFETPERTRRLIASFLGLPLTSHELTTGAEEPDLSSVQELAQFLRHSDLGNNLTEPQRVRLAAQFQERFYPPGEYVARYRDGGTDMFVVHDGSLEVWSDPDAPIGAPPNNPRCVAAVTPGQLTGELAMLDGGQRSADLRAGPNGANVLSLSRERLRTISDDDPDLGTALMWNIATAMSLRVRFILWQLQRASQKTDVRLMGSAKPAPKAGIAKPAMPV